MSDLSEVTCTTNSASGSFLTWVMGSCSDRSGLISVGKPRHSSVSVANFFHLQLPPHALSFVCFSFGLVCFFSARPRVSCAQSLPLNALRAAASASAARKRPAWTNESWLELVFSKGNLFRYWWDLFLHDQRKGKGRKEKGRKEGRGLLWRAAFVACGFKSFWLRRLASVAFGFCSCWFRRLLASVAFWAFVAFGICSD